MTNKKGEDKQTIMHSDNNKIKDKSEELKILLFLMERTWKYHF
jgi:hypothetical protein